MVRRVIDANPQHGPFWTSDLVLVAELGLEAVVNDRRTASVLGSSETMEEPESWKTVIDVDGWELTILLPRDYTLITDFELISPSGERYLGSAGTPEMVRQLLDGDDAWNDPFWMSDLVMVRELSEASIVAAVRTLISRDEVTRALDRAEDTSESEELDTP